MSSQNHTNEQQVVDKKPTESATNLTSLLQNVQMKSQETPKGTKSTKKDLSNPLTFDFSKLFSEEKDLIQSLQVPLTKPAETEKSPKKPNDIPDKPRQIVQTIIFSSDKFKTLQEAIDASPSSSQLVIPSGVYNEYLSIDKEITLSSKDGRVQIEGIKSKSPYLCIESIDFDHSPISDNSGIFIECGYTKLSNCHIHSAKASAIQLTAKSRLEADNVSLTGVNHPCLYINKESYAHFTNSTFEGSEFLGILAVDKCFIELIDSKIQRNDQGGILIGGTASINIHKCQIINNVGKGVEVVSIGSIQITETTFANNRKSSALFVAGCTSVHITNCTFKENSAVSIHAQNAASVISTNNKFDDSGNSIMILTRSTGSFTSNHDTLEGDMDAGIATCEGGQAFIDDLHAEDTNGTVLYAEDDSSLLCCTNSTIRCIKDIAIQAENHARMELENVTIEEPQDVGFVIINNAIGTFKKVYVKNGKEAGGNIRNVQSFSFEECEFIENNCGFVFEEEANVTFDRCIFAKNNKTGVAITGPLPRPTFNGCIFEDHYEVGLNLIDGCKATIKNCIIRNNNVSGINVENSSATLAAVTITKNNGNGITAFKGSQVTIEQCTFSENNMAGCSVHESKTLVIINNSKFKDHLKSCAIIAVGGGAIMCTNCTFEGSRSAHCEVRQGAAIALTKCYLSHSLLGNGCQVHSGGFLHLIQSMIHDEKKCAILCSRGGYLEFMSSSLYNCNEIGISIDQNSTAIINNSLIFGKGMVGIQADGGKLTVTDTQFKDFGDAALCISKSTNLMASNVKYENNKKDLVEV
ncbi:AAA family ATPase [Histomonas meleagridis]|uniref:AAA family ATPase n=1 Tax=Histomonas meleagridis TaxID=135588 RepID=UPI00355A9BD3|nr:AAA family ATPase [Histomonas meleagridis]KAH0797774.1 AAA family ATPase [Histomonas meleagridis]